MFLCNFFFQYLLFFKSQSCLLQSTVAIFRQSAGYVSIFVDPFTPFVVFFVFFVGNCKGSLWLCELKDFLSPHVSTFNLFFYKRISIRIFLAIGYENHAVYDFCFFNCSRKEAVIVNVCLLTTR